MVIRWKPCFSFTVLLQFFLIYQVYGVPDLIKLEEGDSVEGDAEKQFGQTVFNIKNTDPKDPACPKTEITGKKFVKDSCGVYLDDIDGMKNEFSGFEFFQRGFNKANGFGKNGKAKVCQVKS